MREMDNMALRAGSRKKILLLVAVLFLTAAAACALYIGRYYRASAEALQTLDEPETSVTVEVLTGQRIAFIPTEPEAGLIFYPGAKVQYEAYAPLMEQCAARGVLCVLIHMPGNLAVLDADAADGVRELYPEVTRWYIGGHSLGGAMAASYAAKHADEYEGLILLAAYSTRDLIGSGLEVLSVYGTEDGVLDAEKYEAYRTNLPEGYTELALTGGSHAQFGSYGAQNGDGVPTITAAEQITRTADAIAAMAAA